MSRRRRQHEHTAHDRWLISYADFITLLFAVFVVLYATSQVDQGRQMVKLGAAVQAAFRELGSFPGTDPNSRVFHQDIKGAALAGTGIGKEGEGATISPLDGSPPDLAKLQKELQASLGNEIQRHEIQMHLSPEGLVISLREVGFFPSGQATLFPEAQPKLARIASALSEDGFLVRVEGHTDSIPIHNVRFKSNWELSTARATEVVSLLTSKYGLAPTRLSVAGFAEFRPVTSNDTEEGRQANRRIDLVVTSRVSLPPSKDATPAHTDAANTISALQ